MLGQRLICCLEAGQTAATATKANEANPNTLWRVIADTRVTLGPPSDTQSSDMGSAESAVEGNSKGDVARLVAVAREAAEREVEGSSQEAAMDAAERAVRTGKWVCWQ